MNKCGEIFTIIGVIVVFVISAVVFGFTGTKNGGYNFVKLEVNPKIEFLTNRKDKIISIMPINSEAKELIIEENFVGLKIEEGVEKFVDLCVKANYIDVDREDNAIKLSIVSGLTQGLEVKVYRTINKYLVNNEVKCIILEGNNDLKQVKLSKEYGVSPSKYSLMLSLCNLYPDISLNSAKKMSEKDMLKKIKIAHEKLYEAINEYSEEELSNKVKLIDFNKAKLNHHNEKITKKSISKFKDEYTQYVKDKKKYYERDFERQYDDWKEFRTDYSYA